MTAIASVAGLPPTVASASGTDPRALPEQTLGQEDFLKLLAEQLKAQDPLEPMKDTDFIAQMANFSSLQQMSGLRSDFGYYESARLIGSEVTAQTTDEAGNVIPVNGTVDRILRNGDNTLLVVAGNIIKPEEILSITAPSAPVSPGESAGSDPVPTTRPEPRTGGGTTVNP